MPLQTDLSGSPYFDDIRNAQANNYYKILFQPKLSVQTRELNQLQTLLQNQIETFGDNIYQSGTIISGCNFAYNNNFSYAQLNDSDVVGDPVTPWSYIGLYATNQNGVQASIQMASNGYVSTAPYLKTIYLKYTSAGNTSQAIFAPGDSLIISSIINPIYNTQINFAGSGYSNSDSVIFVSAISVNTIAGAGFSNGETVLQPSSNTRAVIVGVNNSIYSNRTVLFLSPHPTDLGNTNLNTTPWVMANTVAIVGNTSGTTATVIDVIGDSALGRVITDGAGRVVDIVMSDQGEGYRLAPYATVKPIFNSGAISSGLSLTAWNYVQDVTVAQVANSIGVGYSMSITAGVVYQKGFFIDVAPQTVIVSPFSPTPNNLSVYFSTIESIITPQIDPTLYDNALGEPNITGPGANRMQLIPILSVANTDYLQTLTDTLILTSFSAGLPWRQTQATQFNSVETEMAKRMNDADGNFVLDPFFSTTTDMSSVNNSSNVSLVVDAGSAYIDGYYVETHSNYTQSIPKGITTATANQVAIAMAYDNYVQIKEVGGIFNFNIGDTVSFYSSPKQFISNTHNIFTSNTSPAGSLIATASMRSMTLVNGTPGTNNAIYNLYIFNLSVQPGKNFLSAQSVSYAGGPGIADLVLTQNPITSAYQPQIIGNNSTLVFSPGTGPIQQVSNVTYLYRTINSISTVSNLGTGSISLVSNPSEVFPYTGNANLNNSQLQDLIVVPLSNNFLYSTPITGTVSINGTSANIVGSGTAFTTTFTVGDYIAVSNSTVSDPHQIIAVISDTLAIMDSNSSVGTLASANVARYFPPNVPIPFGSRSWLYANLTANAAILTLNYGGRFAGSTSANVAISYNAKRSSVSPGTKIAKRNNFIVINTSNHVANSIGPWSIGVPDVVRMKGVWLVNSTQTSPAPNSTVLTPYFYINNNEDTDMVGQAYLYQTSASKLNLANVYILVEFDIANTTIKGFYSTDSYVTANSNSVFATDMLTSDQLSTTFSSWEIPEFNDSGEYFDMTSWIDFRPSAQTTANLNTVSYNPNTSIAISTASDWKFPVPGSTMTASVSYYLGRIDTVVVDKNGFINDITGVPSLHPVGAAVPNTCMIVDQLNIPPYPTLPQRPSSNTANAIATYMSVGGISSTRIPECVISSIKSTAPSQTSQPQGYTMAHIGELERRISDLEYYVSLNSLETLVTQQAIPSSVSGSVSRFQYGFFADDFSTTNFANMADPEWSATIFTNEDQCWPKSETFNVLHELVNQVGWEKYLLDDQSLASVPVGNTTSNGNTVTNSNTIINACPFGNVSGNSTFRVSLFDALPIFGGTEKQFYTFPDYPIANVCLYMVGLQAYTGDYVNPWNVGLFQIQGSYSSFDPNDVSKAVNSGNNYTGWSQADLDFIFSQDWWNHPHPIVGEGEFQYTPQNLQPPNSIFCSVPPAKLYKLKFKFDYDPANGRTIVLTKPWLMSGLFATGLYGYFMQLTYVIQANTFFDCSNNGATSIPISQPMPNTSGNTVSSNVISNNNANNYIPQEVTLIYPESVCEIIEYGCSPGSTYAVFYGNTNIGPQCVPPNGNFGSSLVASNTGVLLFGLFVLNNFNFVDISDALDPGFAGPNITWGGSNFTVNQGTTSVITISNITVPSEPTRYVYVTVK